MKAVLAALGITLVISFSTGCATDVDEEEEQGETASEGKRPYCKDFNLAGKGGCARPVVEVKAAMPALLDRNGDPGKEVAAGQWAVSSCTPSTCVIYRSGGKIYTVNKDALVQNTASKTTVKEDGSKHVRDNVLKNRAMDFTSNRPSGKTYRATPIDITEPADGGFAPPDGDDGIGNNDSVAGRGDGNLVMWGVETPTGAPKSSTGYAGVVIDAGTELIDAGAKPASGAPWVNKAGKPAADATWRQMWTPVAGGWVKQWVLTEVVSRKTKKKYTTATSK